MSGLVLKKGVSLASIWNKTIKQLFILVLVLTFLQLDFSYKSGIHFKCLVKRNILYLREEEWLTKLQYNYRSYNSSNYFNSRNLFYLLASLCKNDKRYNNYQVCRSRDNYIYNILDKESTFEYNNTNLMEPKQEVGNWSTRRVQHCEPYVHPSTPRPTFFRNYFFASANTFPRFTTEDSIFTGLPKPMPSTDKPLGDFHVSVEEGYGTYSYLRISWFKYFDVSKIKIFYTELSDNSSRTIELPVNLNSNITANIYKQDSLRSGFIYRLPGLIRRSRYYVTFWAYLHNGNSLHTYLSFLTDDSDKDDRLYNLNGIFLVLGISTIIMVVVLICVGYEKLLHQKKNDCINIILCRKKKKAEVKIASGTISPEPLVVGRRSQVVPMDQDSSSNSSIRGYERY